MKTGGKSGGKLESGETCNKILYSRQMLRKCFSKTIYKAAVVLLKIRTIYNICNTLVGNILTRSNTVANWTPYGGLNWAPYFPVYFSYFLYFSRETLGYVGS